MSADEFLGEGKMSAAPDDVHGYVGLFDRVLDAVRSDMPAISRDEIVGHGRRHVLVRQRHLAMWLIREIGAGGENTLARLAYSYPRIGKMFSGRDHTSVMYGVREIERKRAADEEFRARSDGILGKVCMDGGRYYRRQVRDGCRGLAAE